MANDDVSVGPYAHRNALRSAATTGGERSASIPRLYTRRGMMTSAGGGGRNVAVGISAPRLSDALGDGVPEVPVDWVDDGDSLPGVAVELVVELRVPVRVGVPVPVCVTVPVPEPTGECVCVGLGVLVCDAVPLWVLPWDWLALAVPLPLELPLELLLPEADDVVVDVDDRVTVRVPV